MPATAFAHAGEGGKEGRREADRAGMGGRGCRCTTLNGTLPGLTTRARTRLYAPRRLCWCGGQPLVCGVARSLRAVRRAPALGAPPARPGSASGSCSISPHGTCDTRIYNSWSGILLAQNRHRY